MSVKVIDKGYNELVKRVKTFGVPEITVGVHPDKGSKQHGKSKLTVSQVALIHEFGAGKVPERSFIRAFFDENSPKNYQKLLTLMQLFIRLALTKRAVTDQYGQYLVDGIKKRMRAHIPPPLKPATIKRRKRGGNTPLVDTEQLISAIDYKVKA